jgi:hypothetical protein
MKAIASLKERSPLSRAGRGFAALLFAALGGIAFVAEIEPGWAKWSVVTVAAIGLLTVTLWKAPEKDEAVSEEEIVEIARRAIKTEATRLDAKRQGLEKILMAYGEWMEFPDFKTLQTIDWKDEAHVAMDSRVAALLDNEADLMLQRFSSGVYWTSGTFEAKQLLLDLASFTEAIARIYRPESDLPLLELNLESLFKAINRASLQIILLIEELPILEVKEMNLRKVSENIRTASKVYRKYEELQPYLKPVRYLWHGSKMLITSNPLLAAGWIAGSELLWKGGMQIGKKAMDAYLLSLVRQTLGIVAWETAGIYDRTHRYRSPDWVYGVELAHLLSKFDTTQEVLREAFRELGKIPLRSTYDRIFLYRCIAQNASPKPGLFAQPELLAVATRIALRDQLLAFYEKNISANAATENAATLKWKAGLEERLGI